MRLVVTYLLGISMIICPVVGFSLNPQQDDNYLIKKGLFFSKQNNSDSSVFYFKKALDQRTETDNQLQISYLNKLLGTEYIYKGEYDTAISYLTKSSILAEKLKNDTIRANANSNLGYVMLLIGKTDTAGFLLKKSLGIFKSIADTIGMAKAYNLLSILYKTTGNLDEGIEAALKSTYYFKKFDKKQSYVRSLINLGNIYERLGENDTAYSCYEICYNLSLEDDNPAQALTALVNMGVTDFNYGIELKEKGDKEGAMKMYQRSNEKYARIIEISKQNNDKKTLALCYSNVSNLQREFEQYEAAISSSKQALQLAREFGDVVEEIHALKNLGLSYMGMKKYEIAKDRFLEYLALSRKAKYMEDQETALASLSSIYEISGDYKTALQYEREASIVRDSILNTVKQEEIEKHKTNFEILHLKDQNRIKELDKKRIRAERNTTLGIGISLVVLLIIILILFRMRARKNRIIAAQKIQKLEDEKKLMAARSVLVGQEKERERIARELHDGIGVLLSTASIHFSSVESKTDTETGKMLKKANQLLKEAGKEVRQISHNMMPGVLSKFGLKEAIEDLFEEIEETGKIEIDLDLTCGEERLPENMEIMIYRIIQEMINNTLKHAKASKIELFISRGEDEIIIDFSDDGIGFEEPKLPQEKNLGLSGIRSRVEYLGGNIELTSKPGEGTHYSINLPLIESIN